MAPEPSPKTGTATGSTRPILHDTAAAHPGRAGGAGGFGPNPGIHQPPTRGHARPAAPLTIPTSTTCPYGHGPDRHVGAATGCLPSTPSDSGGRLQGVACLVTLLQSDPAQDLSEVCDTDPVRIGPDTISPMSLS